MDKSNAVAALAVQVSGTDEAVNIMDPAAIASMSVKGREEAEKILLTLRSRIETIATTLRLPTSFVV
jgi:hypothetical protein